jgi:hypothetical protein
VARWDDSVQHYWLSLVVQLDRAARLFVCVGCRIQVVLCSRCDRGNRYCGRACWRQTHDLARREAACRYQRSRGGRVRHAARSQRWRQRAALRCVQSDGVDIAGCAGGDAAHKVTHQGSLPGVAAAPLEACTHDTATTAADPSADAPACASVRRCHHCAAEQPDWLRQGFLRRGRHAMTLSTGWRHDHSP